MAHSPTIAINEHSNELRAAGREVFKLGLGQSPFPVPDSVVQVLRAHAAEKDYLPVHGLRSLRDAVAEYHRQRHGLEGIGSGVSGDGVLIGPGSKELLFLLQLSYYGDLVLPSPSWVSYPAQAGILGRRVRWVPTRRSERFALRASALREIAREDHDRPRLLLLNYPCNPTGYTLTEAELQAIAEVARAHRMVVLSDEIYGELHHRGEHLSIAPFYPEGTIVSAGLSKWCGGGGWRLGTFLFPPQLSWLREAMAAVATETFTSTCAPIQYAAVRAFAGGSEIDDYLARSRRLLAALGRHVAATLRSAGAHCDDPDGGFYLFPDFETHRESLGARGIGDATALCTRLLEDTGVAILPGVAFGRPAHELTCRLAYVNFDGGAVLDAVAQKSASEALDEQFLRSACPRTCRAIDRLCDWLVS